MKQLVFFTLLLFGTHYLKAQSSQKTLKQVKQDTVTMLQGKWVSVDDKKSFIVFEGFEQIDIYGKDTLGKSSFNLYNGCPEKFILKEAKRRNGSHLAVKLEDDVLCYAIEGLSSNRLILLYTSRGNFLQYRKVK